MTENKKLWSRTRVEHNEEHFTTKKRIKEIYEFFGWEYD